MQSPCLLAHFEQFPCEQPGLVRGLFCLRRILLSSFGSVLDIRSRLLLGDFETGNVPIEASYILTYDLVTLSFLRASSVVFYRRRSWTYLFLRIWLEEDCFEGLHIELTCKYRCVLAVSDRSLTVVNHWAMVGV